MMTRHEYLSNGAKLSALRGVALPQSKLSEQDVIAIRINRHGKTRKALAAQYEVHYRTIEKIQYRETWIHI